MERERIFGQTNLRTFADGTRVLRTLAAEHRRAARKRAERVHMEEQSRALTPPGGIPVAQPADSTAPARRPASPSRSTEGRRDTSHIRLALEEEAS